MLCQSNFFMKTMKWSNSRYGPFACRTLSQATAKQRFQHTLLAYKTEVASEAGFLRSIGESFPHPLASHPPRVRHNRRRIQIYGYYWLLWACIHHCAPVAQSGVIECLLESSGVQNCLVLRAPPRASWKVLHTFSIIVGYGFSTRLFAGLGHPDAPRMFPKFTLTQSKTTPSTLPRETLQISIVLLNSSCIPRNANMTELLWITCQNSISSFCLTSKNSSTNTNKNLEQCFPNPHDFLDLRSRWNDIQQKNVKNTRYQVQTWPPNWVSGRVAKSIFENFHLQASLALLCGLKWSQDLTQEPPRTPWASVSCRFS